MVTQGTRAVSKAGGQVVDPATRTIAIPLSASANPRDPATLVQVRSAVQAGLTDIALKTGAITANGTTFRPLPPAPEPGPVKLDDPFNPLDPGPVEAGKPCYPDDISDADAATAACEQLVCQLTNVSENVTIPASFQNAQAGDIILSPAPVGGGDLIAAMFSALTPPQHHGHSGIMTANFFEITHCTASVDRITANLNKDSHGIPTSLNGNMLQYAWPGSLTQSVGDASSSMNFKDPSGATYTMSSFNFDSTGDVPEIIPPLVVKPLPENEATVRPTLRKAADTARSKGASTTRTAKGLLQGAATTRSTPTRTRSSRRASRTSRARWPGGPKGWPRPSAPRSSRLSLKANNIPLVSNNPIEAISDFSPRACAGGRRWAPPRSTA